MVPTEKLVITRLIPGLDSALEIVPTDWNVVSNPSEDSLPRKDLLDLVEDCTGILAVSEKIDKELLESAPQLRAVTHYGIGVDNIDIDSARRRGVMVMNLPDEVTQSTAELTMALLLTCSRRIVEADGWTRRHNPFTWSPTNLIGSTIYGKTLGLVGFGRIGQRVATMAKSFGMDVMYTARSRRRGPENQVGAKFVDLYELLRTADAISLHVPGTRETLHLIGRSEFEIMKPQAILINTSRGFVVDEPALVDALVTKGLRAAGLDVYENEPYVTESLIRLDNVVLTPHVGTSTWDTREQMTQAAVETLVTALLGGEAPNRVA